MAVWALLVSYGAMAGSVDAKIQFNLIDHNGRTVSQDDFIGKPTLMFFGFTRCPDICPTFLSEVTTHLDDMAELAGQLNVVFVSLDPKHDTVAVLSKYMRSFSSRVVAVTGPVDAVDTLARTLNVKFSRETFPNGDVRVDHTVMSFILDRNGCAAGRMLIGHGVSREKTAAALRSLIVTGE